MLQSEKCEEQMTLYSFSSENHILKQQLDLTKNHDGKGKQNIIKFKDI